MMLVANCELLEVATAAQVGEKEPDTVLFDACVELHVLQAQAVDVDALAKEHAELLLPPERLGDLAVLDRLVLKVVLLGIPVGPAAVNDKLLGREAVGGVAALSSFPSMSLLLWDTQILGQQLLVQADDFKMELQSLKALPWSERYFPIISKLAGHTSQDSKYDTLVVQHSTHYGAFKAATDSSQGESLGSPREDM